MQPMLSFEFYLIVLLLITLVLGGLYIYYDRKKGRHKEDPSYLEGLKFMAEGENRRAIEKFKEAVKYIWEIERQPPYLARGSHIFDTEGNKAGVYYAGLYVTVKFGPDNQIQVMPDTVHSEGFLEERVY